jgi:hypothetical protein
MNFTGFIDSLNKQEFSGLRHAMWVRNDREAQDEIKDIVLTDKEKLIYKEQGFIKCITELRARTGINLMAAKNVLDRENYRP